MQENIHKNEQVLQQIEWKTITDTLSGCTHFDFTLQNILTYLDDRALIELKLDSTKKYTDFLYANDFKAFSEEIYHLGANFDAKSKISRIKKSMALNLADLNEFAISIEIFLDNSKLIETYFDSKIIETDFNKFKREVNKAFLTIFRKFVSPEGEVNLSKHPLIAPLYQKQLELEGQIRSTLGSILNSSDMQKKLQFNSFDIVNERYVIPIRSDSFNSKLGQIVSRSESGNTLFIEPKKIALANQTRIEFIVEIQAILAKVELELTNSLQDFVHDLYKITAFYFECDEYIARSKFAGAFNLSYPSLSKNKEIKLKNAFHPLIESPVKNDIHISPTDGGLIISGPNTGGKTATLKTLALTQLFLHYGLFIPCDYGDIFLYEKIFYFGNDQQDLHSGLSSFSAEVQNYTSLFENLGQSNLVLIDEIFNSTSSEEASALAIAFFKKLHEITDIHLVVSSHHQTLKTILHQDNNYISAHVGFNTDNNSPTYKLHYGSPGSSHALRIFNSMTKDHALFKDVYNNSLNFLDNKVIHYEKLLESIAEKEHQLNKTLTENNDLNKQLKNQKQSMEGVIKLKIQERVEKTEKKLSKIFLKAENILSQTKRGEISKIRQIDKQRVEINSEVKELVPQKNDAPPKPKYENMSIPSEIFINQEYFCMTLHKTILVKKIDKNKKSVHIGIGNISMKVPASSLRLANKGPQEAELKTDVNIYTKSRDSKLEYDCRGMRLEEFQNLIQDITSDLILEDVPFITIIHGHGNGILKNWLRTHIKRTKELAIVSSDSGNDGETRIELI